MQGEKAIVNRLPKCEKVIPIWLVFLNNLPTLGMFVLGMLIIGQFNTLAGVGYIIYAVFSIIWFWARICTQCHQYATKACPCGYGVISAMIFKKKQNKNFADVFRRHISILFPVWFIPPILSVYLLVKGFSLYLFLATILFSTLAFILIPLISKIVSCKDCTNKAQCPWMKKKEIRIINKDFVNTTQEIE